MNHCKLKQEARLKVIVPFQESNVIFLVDPDSQQLFATTESVGLFFALSKFTVRLFVQEGNSKNA